MTLVGVNVSEPNAGDIHTAIAVRELLIVSPAQRVSAFAFTMKNKICLDSSDHLGENWPSIFCALASR